MSLRTKFTLLVALLGITVAVSLGSAVWSVALLEREVARPFASSAEVLSRLGLVKRSLEAMASILMRPAPGAEGADHEQDGSPAVQGVRGLRWGVPGAAPDPGALPEFERAAAEARERLGDVEVSAFFAERVGAVTARNLRRNAESAMADGLAWFQAADADRRRAAVDRMFDLHELIEAVEGRLLDDADIAVSYGRAIRERLMVIVGLSLLNALLISALGLALFRRWVTRPVAALQTAAERIGSGDFDHRIAVRGRDELARLSREVNAMAATVVRMQNERVQRERLAAMGELIKRLSHNLRNPLAGIRGVAEVTSRRLDEGSPLRANMERITASVDRLDMWLRDLVSTTSPMEIRPTEQAVGGFLEGLAAAHRPTAAAKSLEFRVDVSGAPAKAVFDRRHLEQAVTAIISNAIQATPAGGWVSVVAAAGQVEARNGSPNGTGSADWWEIRVADSGPGVPEELREKIFRAHFTTKPDGSGIGLAVAQQVVQSHGGCISVQSGQREGGKADGAPAGAVFSVRLPLVARPAGPAEDGHGAVGDENSRR